MVNYVYGGRHTDTWTRMSQPSAITDTLNSYDL